MRKFLDREKRLPGTDDEGVFLKSDRRVYLDLSAVKKIMGGESEAVALLDRLSVQGVLQRGFVFLCSFCRNADWYSIAELNQQFKCKRCEHPQVFTVKHWKQPAQPNLYHKLDEIVYQGLAHDMAVPICALDYWRKRAKRSFDFTSEIEIWKKGENRPTLEVDICCLVDGSLIIGEAKTVDTLGKSRKEERATIANYWQLAADIGAATVVFATRTLKWSAGTVQEIQRVFSTGTAKPVILTGDDL